MTGRGHQHCSAGGRPLNLAAASDGDLLALMGRKEDTDLARAAWGAFYSRHVTFLSYVCSRAYGRRLGTHGVEDLVADTFRRAYTHGAPTYQSDVLESSEVQLRRVQGWLTTIAEHLACEILAGSNLERTHFEQEEWQNVPEKAHETVPEITADVRHVMQSILTEREADVLWTTLHWHDPTKEHQKLPEAVLSNLAKRWKTTPDNIRQIRSRALRKLKDALESVVARPSEER
jgi:DNA-directed RNA polymerase specialized sigma24 family protein